MTQKEIFDFVDSQKTAFIASVDEDGFPNMKAMLAPRERDGVTFNFTTNTSSMRVKQYLENPKASVYFYHRGRFRYTGVMLKGTMSVLKDQETKKESGAPAIRCSIKKELLIPTIVFYSLLLHVGVIIRI